MLLEPVEGLAAIDVAVLAVPEGVEELDGSSKSDDVTLKQGTCSVKRDFSTNV